ncbi:hypothetical protein KSP40_PGU018700 [Platanthera guangdongensis]|uniref:Uncharacterized protein n=1 Tax=Platanthera guangdongensis TaxID=2320717 RepID=A0ABR2MUD7_9ASPA
MLHNFAGNIEMYGVLDSIASGPSEARTSENSTMVGVGMCMEGIEQNPVVYDLMPEMAFHHHKVDTKEWLNSYPRRRYGKLVPALQDAWRVLHHSIYNCTDGANDKNRDVIVAFPDVEPSVIWKEMSKSSNSQPISRQSSPLQISSSFDHPHLWYSTTDVIHALELFLTYGDEVSESSTFRYDLIDLTRQALAKYGNEVFLKVIEAYTLNDVNEVAAYSQRFLDIVEDLDTLLACHEGILLGLG